MKLYDELKSNLFLMAGPCVIESKDIMEEAIVKLLKYTKNAGIPFIFKSSYDKANRTSVNSYRGPGMKEGLQILVDLKKEHDLNIVTDVHTPDEVEQACKVADILQIPAFLCRQTDLILAAGKSKKIVNVKKGQFLSPESMKFVVEKLESVGCHEILITERGTSFGYGHLIVDFTGISIMKKFGYPVIFDATHSVQRPSLGETITGGNRDAIPKLLYSAIASGVDGIFMEVHPNPEEALCDKASQLPLELVSEVLNKAVKINEVIK